jgi:hypothetical protein
MGSQTIQIFLPDGDPTGIKVADIQNRIIAATLLPRNKIQEADTCERIKQPGIYFLFGETEEKARPIVYIGQARDCLQRIRTHDQKKKFWSYAIVITSKTDSFTTTHIEYLEYLSIKKTIDVRRYDMDNRANPKEPHIQENMKTDLLDNYETIKLLLATLGFPVFEEIRRAPEQINREPEQITDIFYCSRHRENNIVSEGNLIDGTRFVVYKNSRVAKKTTPKCADWVIDLRKKLKKNKILREENGFLTFSSDYIFDSPSAAASVVLGTHSNGWTEWKNRNTNKTLNDVYRS